MGGEGFELGGLAWIGNNMNGYGICNKNGYNTGISRYYGRYWQTFAHELGHNFGGFHSFEEGQGQTGGLMDYGDQRLNGVYQFNTKHRKAEMCALVDSRVSQCGSNFKVSGPTPPPTPTPPATCDDCNDGFCLWTDGKCYPMSEDGCRSQEGAHYCQKDIAATSTTVATTISTTSATTATTTTSTSSLATQMTTSASTTIATLPQECGACSEFSPCLWTDGMCYPMSKDMCIAQAGAHYCESSTAGSSTPPLPVTTVVSTTSTASTTRTTTTTTTTTTPTTSTMTRSAATTATTTSTTSTTTIMTTS